MIVWDDMNWENMRWNEMRNDETRWEQIWCERKRDEIPRMGQDSVKIIGNEMMKWKAMSDKWWERMKNDKIKATRGRECASMGWAAPDPQDYLAEAKATPASYRLFFWILEKGGGER